MNPLRKAANTNNINILSKILMNNSDPRFVNDVDTAGRTALMIAAERGNIQSVQLLLNYDADTTVRTIKGMTALICASNRGHADVVKLLIKYGANLNVKDFHGGTALIYAAKFGNIDCLKELVLAGTEIDMKDKWGMTALMYSSREGYYDCVEFLIEHGCDIFLTDKTGKLASQYASSEVILDLIESCEMTTPPSTPRNLHPGNAPVYPVTNVSNLSAKGLVMSKPSTPSPTYLHLPSINTNQGNTGNAQSFTFSPRSYFFPV